MTVSPLKASRDEVTGDVYVPPRRFAADGSLRECVPCELAAEGILVSWTAFQGDWYGLIDLADGVRIQTRLGPGPHESGRAYAGTADPDADAETRFHRV
jgi:hypothetical protein